MKILIAFLIATVFVFANVGKVSAIKGSALLIRDSKESRVTLGMSLNKSDIIQTKTKSVVQIAFNDNTIITIGKNSALNINDYVYDKKNPKNSKTDFNFFKGTFKVISGNIGKINREKFKLRTKSATMGIRGTVILGNQKMIACTSGQIVVESLGKRVIVSKNQLTITKSGQTPSDPIGISNNNLDILESGTLTSNQKSQSERTGDSTEPSGDTTKKDLEIESDLSKDVASDSNESLKTEEVQTEETKAVQKVKNRKHRGNFLASLSSTAEKFQIENKNSNFIQRDGNEVKLDIKLLQTFDDATTKNYTITSTTTKETSFDEAKAGSFTSFSLLDNISYNFGSYGYLKDTLNLMADNMGEVFYAYKDNPNENFDLLFFSGKNSLKYLMNNDKYYVYNNIASILQTKDSDELITSSNLDTTQNGYYYYNPKLKSLTYLDTNILSSNRGASKFTIGDNENINTYTNDFTYASDNGNGSYLVDFKKSLRESDFSIKGTDYQALTFSSNSNIENYNFVENTTDKSSDMSIGISQKVSEKDLNSSSEITLEGFMIAQEFGKNDYNEISNGDIEFTIDRSTGAIKGVGTNNLLEVGNFDMQLDASVAGDTSYYISDDLFGAKFTSTYTTYSENMICTGNCPAPYSLYSNSGYMLAIPDGGIVDSKFSFYDANDNPIMSDDESSWGYWTSTFTQNDEITKVVDPNSAWVAGTVTNVDVSNMNSGSYTFLGKTIGSVNLQSGGYEQIKQDNTNIVSFNFDFGAGQNIMAGSYMKFKTASTTWNLNVGTSTITSNSFNGDFTGGSTGSFNGKFYGADSIKSIGGKFNASDGEYNQANGVFKAIRN